MPRATRKTTLPVEQMFALTPVQQKDTAKRGAAALTVETAFDQIMSYLDRFPDPDEVLKKLGVKREDMRQLESDDDLVGALDTRREAVLSVPWRLEPGTGRAATFVEDELRPVMEPLVRCIFAAVPYGYSVGEIIYAKRDGGRLGLHAVVEKPLEWFAPQPDGSLLWYSLQHPEGELADPIKFLLSVRQPTYRNPYGEALFTRLYWPWFFRKNGWRFWAQWLERYGQPFLIAMTKSPLEEMSARLANALQGAAIAIHDSESVTQLETAGTGEQFKSFEDTIVRRYQRAILGQTLTSDVGDKGSYAAAKVHDAVRLDKRNADLRLVTNRIQALVGNLWLLNGFPGKPPEFVMADEVGLELDRAERDVKLVNAGILKLTPEYLMDRYDFREGDFEIPEPPPQLMPGQLDQPGDQQGAPASGKVDPDAEADNQGKEKKDDSDFAAPGLRRFTPGQQAIEVLAANTLSGLPNLIEQAAILRVIRLSDSAEDLAERLALLLPDANRAEFQAVFERAMFSAEIMGYAHAQDPTANARLAAPQTINLTAQFEAPPQPTVVVNVPEQPPPLVQVTNEVPVPSVTVEATPAVTLNATVEVPPRRTETVIERDADGNITRAVQTDEGVEGRTLN